VRTCQEEIDTKLTVRCSRRASSKKKQEVESRPPVAAMGRIELFGIIVNVRDLVSNEATFASQMAILPTGTLGCDLPCVELVQKRNN
jgi:hypothetical protein